MVETRQNTERHVPFSFCPQMRVPALAPLPFDQTWEKRRRRAFPTVCLVAISGQPAAWDASIPAHHGRLSPQGSRRNVPPLGKKHAGLGSESPAARCRAKMAEPQSQTPLIATDRLRHPSPRHLPAAGRGAACSEMPHAHVHTQHNTLTLVNNNTTTGSRRGRWREKMSREVGVHWRPRRPPLSMPAAGRGPGRPMGDNSIPPGCPDAHSCPVPVRILATD